MATQTKVKTQGRLTMQKDIVMFLNGLNMLCFVFLCSLFFMGTSEVPAPGGSALVSHATVVYYLAVILMQTIC